MTSSPTSAVSPVDDDSSVLHELQLLTRTHRIAWDRPVREACSAAGFGDGLPAARWADLPWYGPLEVFRHDASTSDILINGPGRDIVVWQDGCRLPTGIQPHREWIEFAQRQLLLRSGVITARTMPDWSQPLRWPRPLLISTADQRLRFAVTQPPATPSGPTVTVRVLPQQWRTLDDLIKATLLTREAADVLLAALRAGVTILTSGGTGSGKTTITAALLQAIGAEKRVVLIEEARELPELPDSVANEVGHSGITFSECVRFALRQKPDLIVVGEVRGPEALALLQGAATGHPGIGTIHAGDAQAALKNLARMACEGGEVRPEIVRGMLSSSTVPLLVIHIGKLDGRRAVLSIDEVKPTGASGQLGDPFVLNPLFRYDPHSRQLQRAGWVQNEWGRGRL